MSSIDIHAAHQDGRTAPMNSMGWNNHYNIDGTVTISGNSDGTTNYTQLFRNGVLEAVAGGIAVLGKTGSGGEVLIPGYVELAVFDRVASYRELLLSLGMPAPMAICISILNVRGMAVTAPRDNYVRIRQGRPALDRNELLLPMALDEDGRQPLDSLLQPAFDALWQSGDYSRSVNFDDNGRWKR